MLEKRRKMLKEKQDKEESVDNEQETLEESVFNEQETVTNPDPETEANVPITVYMGH